MRQLIRLAAMMLLLLLPAAAVTTDAAKKKKTVTWENPKRMYANTWTIDVTKVELSDTATTLYMHAEYSPGEWIRIDAKSQLVAEDGKTYPIKSGEGLTPGEKFVMPTSAQHDFKLHFAPLPKDTRMFDFTEGDTRGGWKIFGIRDAGTKLNLGIPDELRNMKYTPNETLPAVVLSRDKVKVTCRVYGYRPEMKAKMHVIYSVIAGKQKSIDVPINDDGTVSFEVEPDGASSFVMGIASVAYATIYAMPGEEISCAISMDNGDDTNFFGFTGYRQAQTTYEMEAATGTLLAIRNCRQEMLDGITGRSAEVCAAFLNSMLKKQKDRIDALNLSGATKQLMRMKVEEDHLRWRFDYKGQYRSAIYNINRDKIKTEEDYRRIVVDADVPDYKGDLLCDFPDLECLNADYALFSNALLTYSGMGKKLPTTNRRYRQVATTHAYMCDAITMDDATEATITDSYLKQLIADKREKDRKLNEEMAASNHIFFHRYDEVKPEDILPTILKKYEGRAVFVDIWATWCGPCRAGHKQMKPLKEELKDKNVVFIYITSPSSPSDTWKEMIDGIPGDHYYLTKEQYNYILDKYESDGIPTYLLFDTKGNLSFKSIGSKSNDEFRSEIEKAMGPSRPPQKEELTPPSPRIS